MAPKKKKKKNTPKTQTSPGKATKRRKSSKRGNSSKSKYSPRPIHIGFTAGPPPVIVVKSGDDWLNTFSPKPGEHVDITVSPGAGDGGDDAITPSPQGSR